MIRKLSYLVGVIFFASSFISCETELIAEGEVNDCQPIIHNLTHSWSELAGFQTCNGKTYSNSFWILADYTGCIDSTISIQARLTFYEADGTPELTPTLINDQWYTDLGGKIYFGYCVNWGTYSYMRVSLNVVTASGEETNQATMVVNRQPGT